jgi:tetratricopeptide (TPR) repeat protein
MMATGRYDAALRAQERALELALGAGYGYLAAASSSAMAMIHHNLGNADTVEQLMQETLERFEMPIGNALSSACYAEIGFCAMMDGQLELTHMACAQVAMAGGDVAGGLELLAGGESKARSMGMLPMAQMLSGGLAQAHTAAGNDDEAAAAMDRHRETITEIAAQFTEADLASAYTAASLGALD